MMSLALSQSLQVFPGLHSAPQTPATGLTQTKAIGCNLSGTAQTDQPNKLTQPAHRQKKEHGPGWPCGNHIV